jgi:predicted dienelactone hydrolase
MSSAPSRRRSFLSLPRDFIHRRRFRRRLTNFILIPLLSVIVAYVITRPTGGAGFTLPRALHQASLSAPANQQSERLPISTTFADSSMTGAATASGSPSLPASLTTAMLGGGYMLDDGPNAIREAPDIVFHDAERNRDLHLRVVYPNEPGPYPVIVFSADARGSHSCCDALTRHWAGYGYVILQLTGIASTHAPRTAGEENVTYMKADSGSGNESTAWQGSPEEVSFVLDSLHALQNLVTGLAGKIDANHIGVGGDSSGAFTADALAGAVVDLPGRRAVSFADPRVQAVLLLSPQGPGEFGLTSHSWDHLTVPLLSITGSLDNGPGKQSPQWREMPFERSQPGDKYQVFIRGADPLSLTSAKELVPGRASHGEPVISYTNSAALAFWDAYLKNDPKAKIYLQSGALPDFSHGAVRLTRR